MADRHAGTVDPSLLEVVPWTYGFAHSWALGALIVDTRTAAAVLNCFGLPESELASDVQRERSLNAARADLAFSVRDQQSRMHEIAVETKVNDPFHASQVQAYRDQGHLPALFLPGLTGVLLDPTPTTAAGEVRITGGDLLAALDTVDVGFGPLLKGYLDVLRAETDRIERALRAAREGSPVPVDEGESPALDLANVAWLAEVYRALPAACERLGVEAGASMRVEANDRGIFLRESFRWVLDEGGLWVDVMADVRSGGRAVAVKAGEARMADAWDLAAASGPPGDGWRRTARRVSGQTVTVWKRSLADATASESAAEIAKAVAFIDRLPA